MYIVKSAGDRFELAIYEMELGITGCDAQPFVKLMKCGESLGGVLIAPIIFKMK